ncbi:MAG: MFS transporter [Parvibaculaceae bacterium]
MMSTAAPSNPLYRLNVVIVAGCIIALIAFGVRATAGLFNAPMSEANGWGREVFGLAFALQNLIWGLAQPFVGMVADKFGTMRVVMLGAVIYAVGMLLTAVADAPILLHLGAGLLVGIGIAMTSFSLIMAAFSRLVPPERRSWTFGIATAASSMGQFVFSPLSQAFISAFGWQNALFILAASCLLMIPLAFPLGAVKGGAVAAADEADLTIRQAIGRAFGHGSYVLLVLGFFVCGFQIAFITVHMPPYLVERGVSPFVAGWAIGVVGLFNVVGSYCAGIFGGRHSKRWGLSAIYFLRSVVIVLFLLMPISTASALLFSASMGLLWLSTVPLTMGLVALMFGTRYIATLYGFVFFSHQVGSFFGVYLGGLFYDLYGNYDMVWYLSIALGLFAAIMHLPIREQQAQGFGLAPAR